MKMNAKQLARESKKCVKSEKAERKKVKTAIENGQNEVARIHAENAIRHKTQSLNLLRLSSRMEAIAQRMQSAQTMENLNKSMTNVTKAMTRAVKNMDVVKMSETMEKFEQSFEELDVTSSVMEDSIQQSTGQMMPENDIDALLEEVADEHGLEIKSDLDQMAPPSRVKQNEEEDELERRFNELKSG